MSTLLRIRSMLTLWNDDQGHTVVEVLVALAVFSAVLVPAMQFTAKAMSNSKARDLITATRLAQSAMEQAISGEDFLRYEKVIRVNEIPWRLQRNFKIEEGLVAIQIQVFKKDATRPLVELQTLRLKHD